MKIAPTKSLQKSRWALCPAAEEREDQFDGDFSFIALLEAELLTLLELRNLFTPSSDFRHSKRFAQRAHRTIETIA